MPCLLPLTTCSPLPPSPLCLVTAMALVGRRDPHNTAPYSPEELQAVSQAYADLFNDMTLRQVGAEVPGGAGAPWWRGC